MKTFKKIARAISVGLSGSLSGSLTIPIKRVLNYIWEKQISTIVNSGYPVNAAAYGNGVFVLASGDGQIVTSPDGKIWTKEDSPFLTANPINDIAYSPSLKMFVGVGNKYPQFGILTSTDGKNWIERTKAVGVGSTGQSVCWANGKFVAGGYPGIILTSTDGINWTQQTNPFGTTAIRRITYGNGYFVAVGDAKLGYSIDGITWTLKSGMPTLDFVGITYGQNRFVVLTRPIGGASTFRSKVLHFANPKNDPLIPYAITADVIDIYSAIWVGDIWLLTGGGNAYFTGDFTSGFIQRGTREGPSASSGMMPFVYNGSTVVIGGMHLNATYTAIATWTYPQLETPNALAKGYYAGGQSNSGATSAIDGISFAADTVLGVIANLPSSLASQASFTSPIVGYINAQQGSQHFYKLLYSTNTVFQTSDILPTGISAKPTGLQSFTYGYTCGGDGAADIQTVAFANDAASVLAASLTMPRGYAAGVCSAHDGYVCGGKSNTGWGTNEIDGINFATNTAINPSAQIGNRVAFLASVASLTTGYFMGGASPTSWITTSSMSGLIFSTNSSKSVAATLTAARAELSGTNSNVAGYIAGGTNGGGTYYAVVDKLLFATETNATIGAVLSAARGSTVSLSAA